MTFQTVTRCGVLGVVLTALAAPAFGQGDLSPSTSPAPSMKTLAQIEPREDLTTAPTNRVSTTDADFYYVINAPGSYYLPRNLSAGGLSVVTPAKPSVIRIAADDVTLDLNGFQLRGSNSTFPGWVAPHTAVQITGKRARVTNGSIIGFQYGVYADVGSYANLISHMRVGGCEVAVDGGQGSTVTHCTAEDIQVGDDALSSVISGSSVAHCTVRLGTLSDLDYGISGDTVSDCVVRFLSGGLRGIRGSIISRCEVTQITPTSAFTAIDARIVSHCAVVDITSGGNLIGIRGSSGSIDRCRVVDLTSSGQVIGIQAGSVVSDCFVSFLSGATVIQGIRDGVSGGEAKFRGCVVSNVSGVGAEGFGLFNSESSAEDCSVSGVQTGFRLQNGGTLRGCDASDGATGFLVSADAVLVDCTARDNAAGFVVTAAVGGSVLRDCVAGDNTDNGAGRGFEVYGERNRLLGCQADGNDYNFWVRGDNNHLDRCVAISTAAVGGTGFRDSGSNNTVIRCEAKNCSTNFALSASTRAGPILADPGVATNPFTNFSN